MKRVVFCILVVALLGSILALPAQSRDATVIYLDAGHGGRDPGAVHQFSDGKLLKESDINLDVALALKTLLEQSGHRVIMTRTDDSHVAARDRYPLTNKDNAMAYISIHTNSIDAERAPTIDGACTLYMKDADVPLATILEGALYPALLANAPDPSIFLDRGARYFPSRRMRRMDMPTAIVEPVFLSLPAEAAKLAGTIQRDESGRILANTRRAEIAQALYNGIVSYLGSGTGG